MNFARLPRASRLPAFSCILLAAVTVTAAIAGCSSAPENVDSASEAAAVQGDPAKGYSFLVNGNYIGCGVPYDLLRRAAPLLSLTPGPLRTAFAPMFAGNIFEEPGIPGRTGPNAGLAREFNAFQTSRGNTVVNFNCISCHSERIDGRVIVGLGNSTRDFTQALGPVAAAARLMAASPRERFEVDMWAKRVDAIAPYVQTRTIGVNPAINLSYALFAHRDSRTLAWSDELLIEPPPEHVLPVDVPPWWRQRERTGMFYSSEFKTGHRRIMMLASALCTDSVPEAQALEPNFVDIEAFIKTLAPPPYPRPVELALAARGRDVFETTCASCHGTYGQGRVYRERVIPLPVVGTDPALARRQVEESERFVRWGASSWYGQYAPFSGELGYVAPPLTGIWATAPFLHNGSVPTLEGVLDSKQRPRYWRRSTGSDSYDIVNVGVGFEQSLYGQEAEIRPFQRRYIYDTTLYGYGNGGHTFGDRLEVRDRKAVIEYLKTL